MKKSKLSLIIFLIIIIICVLGAIIVNLRKNKNQSEDEYQNYIPEEEISESQSRQTIVTLYFFNKETGEIASEARLIDAITLVNEPYKELINLLIQGPKNDKLFGMIFNETKINSATVIEGCATIDLSKEFLSSFNNEDEKNKVINSIVNTLTELTEVDSVKILIDGNKEDGINEIYTRIQ